MSLCFLLFMSVSVSQWPVCKYSVFFCVWLFMFLWPVSVCDHLECLCNHNGSLFSNFLSLCTLCKFGSIYGRYLLIETWDFKIRNKMILCEKAGQEITDFNEIKIMLLV